MEIPTLTTIESIGGNYLSEILGWANKFHLTSVGEVAKFAKPYQSEDLETFSDHILNLNPAESVRCLVSFAIHTYILSIHPGYRYTDIDTGQVVIVYPEPGIEPFEYIFLFLTLKQDIETALVKIQPFLDEMVEEVGLPRLDFVKDIKYPGLTPLIAEFSKRHGLSSMEDVVSYVEQAQSRSQDNVVTVSPSPDNIQALLKETAAVIIYYAALYVYPKFEVNCTAEERYITHSRFPGANRQFYRELVSHTAEFHQELMLLNELWQSGL